jgi:hypothetical protein
MKLAQVGVWVRDQETKETKVTKVTKRQSPLALTIIKVIAILNLRQDAYRR